MQEILKPTLDQVYATNAFITTGHVKTTFPHPSQILEPFFQKVGGLIQDYDLQAVVGSHNMSEDGSEQIAYSHLMLNCKIGETSTDELSSRILLLYRLDASQQCTIAYGEQVAACMNMCVFSSKLKYSTDPLKNGFEGAYAYLEEQVLRNYKKWRNEQEDKIDQLKSQRLTAEQADQEIGRMLRLVQRPRGGIKLDNSLLLAAARYIDNEDFVWSKQRNPEYSKWELFNCLTQDIKLKPMESQIEKTLSAYRLLTAPVEAVTPTLVEPLTVSLAA